jgi:hypothetical protein
VRPAQRAFKHLNALATCSMSFTFHSPLQPFPSFLYLRSSLGVLLSSTLTVVFWKGGFDEPSKDAPRVGGVAIVGLGTVFILNVLVLVWCSTKVSGSLADCEVVGAAAAAAWPGTGDKGIEVGSDRDGL